MAKRNFFPEVTNKQVLETGVLLVLICLLLGLYLDSKLWFKVALAATLIILLLPRLFYPVAVGWFALGQVLSRISSLVLLTILFVLLVIPIALLKQLFGKDTLQLKQFKKSKKSVFVNRNHTFTASDIQYPF